MTSPAALYQLMTWLSPSFPVGAYAFSHGLERAIEADRVTDVASATDWISDLVLRGSGQVDLVLLHQAFAATVSDDKTSLSAVIELGQALWPSLEIRTESLAQGEAFLRVACACWPSTALQALKDDGDVAYPVAVAVCAALHDIDIDSLAMAYAHAFTANLTSAIVRLVPLGQTDGQRITRQLLDVMPKAIARAAATPLDDIASASLMSDIYSMQHEIQYTRLFRS
ncbi:MAG: urease accessory protein UreF [Pseudomonadota bacterium]